MYLLDTNILSDAHKRLPAPTTWIQSVDPNEIYISVLTIGEIQRGILKRSTVNPVDAARLSRWLKELRDENTTRILPVAEDVALVWGRVTLRRTYNDADGLIAATALAHDLTLVTRNVADFADTGARLLNSWTG